MSVWGKLRKKKRGTYPAVLLRLLPALTVLADTDNDVQAVVTGVQALAVALGAVTDESKGVVLEVLLELGQRPVTPLVHDLLRTREVKGLDTASRHLQRATS